MHKMSILLQAPKNSNRRNDDLQEIPYSTPLKILGVTEQNLVVRLTCRRGFLHPYFSWCLLFYYVASEWFNLNAVSFGDNFSSEKLTVKHPYIKFLEMRKYKVREI
jgi:hypothetical protein